MGIGFRLRFLGLYSVFEHVTYIHMEGTGNCCGNPHLMGHPCVSDLSSGDSHFSPVQGSLVVS